jgi:hypothetical protein
LQHRGRDYKDNAEGCDYDEYIVGHLSNCIRIRKIKAFAFFLGFLLVFCEQITVRYVVWAMAVFLFLFTTEKEHICQCGVAVGKCVKATNRYSRSPQN